MAAHRPHSGSTRSLRLLSDDYLVHRLECRYLLSAAPVTPDGLTSSEALPAIDYLVSSPAKPLSQRSPGVTEAMASQAAAFAPSDLAADASAAFALSTGSLAGKTVFTSGGHGYFYTTPGAAGGSWTTGRGLTNGIVEDLGNQDQMSYYAQYVLQAGATVVPMRPVGHQTNEVIVDNSDAGFSIVSGTWGSSVQTPYFSTHDGNDTAHYRYATTAATETAVARFTPTIPADGFYPVYAWAKNASDRVTDQTYRVNYTGGSIEIKVDTLHVGSGWVYLGTYYFAAGTGGNVEVSNKSATNGGGQVVIADAIRFGNGMGDTDRGGGVSGKSREDENAYYWITAQRGWTGNGTRVPLSTFNGGNSSDDDANVGAPARWAAYMYSGSFGQAIYLGFHTNAAGGRGVEGLYNNEALFPNTATPNQLDWATMVASEIQSDMLGIGSPPLETPWYDNGTGITFARSDYAFGEIRSSATGDEFDATIAEVAYHDNALDAEILRDPNGRAAIARAAYQATVKYFNKYGGSSAVVIPDAPTDVRAVTNANGSATLTWTAPLTDATTGGAGAPTSYKIYTSTNGYGFDNPITVGNVTSYTVTGLSTTAPTYFKVVAVNAGGESLQSLVVVAKPQTGRTAPILIVNGYDRLDRFNDEKQPYGSSTTDRVRLRYQNTFDYVAQFASAVSAFNSALGIDSVQNEDVESGLVNLANYQAVLWISGTESSLTKSFTPAEQSLIAAYINAGGKFFASGAEIGYDLGSQEGASDKSFLNNSLHAGYVSDDANTYNATGVVGSIFASVGALTFDNGTAGTYNVVYPDVLSASAGSTAALNYSGGTGGAAAVQYSSGNSRVVMMGFPFETLTTAAQRNSVMAAVLTYFGSSLSITPGAPDLLAVSDTGSSSTDNLTRLNNASGNTLQFTVPNVIQGALVKLYADGSLIAQATAAASGSLTLATNNAFTLSNGTHVITATQTESGLTISSASASLTITVDTIAPSVSFAVITNPRTTSLASEGIGFSEAVTGFTAGALTLTRYSAANVLTGAQTLSGSGASYTLNNLADVTSNAGVYVLSLPLSAGVTDAAGNPMTQSASVTWRNTAVTATSGADSISLVRNATDPAAVDVTVNGSSYTVGLAGLGSLTVLGAGGADAVTLDLSNGVPAFDASAGLILNLDSASSLAILGSGGDDTFALSDTSATLNGLPIAFSSSPATVLLSGSGGDDTLSLTNRSAVLASTQRLAALTLSGASTLDLKDNDLIVSGGLTPEQFRQLLLAGKVFSSSAVANSLHTTALGYALASDLSVSTFAGQSVSPSALLVKYTYLGDGDLDGKVTADDLARADMGRLLNRSTWLWGDADYDGSVTQADLDLIHAAFRDQGAIL